MRFKIEKIANMIFITSECGIIFKAWNEEDFTERKLKNAMKKISGGYNELVSFSRTF
jgi:ribonuclease PH